MTATCRKRRRFLRRFASYRSLDQHLPVAAGHVVGFGCSTFRALFSTSSFYTEQLLTVCLGLTLALAFIADTSRPRALERLARGRCCSLDLCGYIALRYENADRSKCAYLPLDGLIVSTILVLLVLEASRRTSGWGFVGIILAMAVYIYISPHLPGDFQTRYVSPERLIDLSRPRHQRRDRLDPAGGGHRRNPIHDFGSGAGAHRRRRFLLRSFDVGDGQFPRRRCQDRGCRLGAVRHDFRQRRRATCWPSASSPFR